MSDDTTKPPTQPPDTTTAPPAQPDAKAAEKKLLDEVKQAKARAKELEQKLAEAQPYVEKFKGHEEAKALEAQRRAEADANESRKREARERAIRDEVMYGLTSAGRKLERKGVALILAGAMSPEAGIALEDDGKVTGVDEYLSSIFATFAPASEPAKPPKTAPGLPDTKTASGATDPKFASLKSFSELLALGREAVAECAEKYPDVYARLKAGHRQGLQNPTRVIPPAAMRGN
jgi:hypothetical protein